MRIKLTRRLACKTVTTSLALALALALVPVAGPAMAQDKYPSKPIRIINPYAPGGAVDIVARIIIEPLREILGQPIVLENKPGGFGMIAGQDLLRQPADGYTLWFGNVNTHAVWPVVHQKKYAFDFAKEVVAVASVADVPSFMAVTTNAEFTPKTLKEMIAFARENPEKVRYGSIGVGSFPHFDMETLAKREGVKMTHIPSKGGAGMVQDLTTGDSHVGFVNVASSAPLVKSGRLRAFAVVSEKRLEDFPDVPTLAELGYPDVATHHWLAVFARTGTPDAVLDTLHKAISEAVERPATKALLEKQVMRPYVQASPAAAAKWHRSELERWHKTVSSLDIKVD